MKIYFAKLRCNESLDTERCSMLLAKGMNGSMSMKKKYVLTGLTLLFFSFAASAQEVQPPTELPPPIIETYGVPANVAPIEVPSETFPQNIPVAEPQTPIVASAPSAIPGAAPVATPDDGTLKGVGLSLGLGVYPIAFDNQTIGFGAGSENGFYFNLNPTASLSTAFKTDGGKKIDFSLGYALGFREYYNATSISRLFDHGIEGSVGIGWTPIITTSFPVAFNYAFKAGADTTDDNSLSVNTSPTLSIKPNKMISFSLTYDVLYIQGLRDVSLSDVNTGSSVGGSSAGGGDFYDGDFDFTGGNYGFSSTGLAATSTETINPEFVWHRLILGSKYSPIENTTLGGTYAYHLAFSSLDAEESTGHWLGLTISQKLFKGTSLGLGNEIRFQKSKYGVVDDGSAKQSMRNRLKFTVQQDITKNMKFDLFYRWQLTGSSQDNYEKLTPAHWFFAGMIFSL